MHATFTIEPGRPGTHRYVLRRSDGDVLVTSAPFDTVAEARAGVEDLRTCVAEAELEELDEGPAQGVHLQSHEHPRGDGDGDERTIGPDDSSSA